MTENIQRTIGTLIMRLATAIQNKAMYPPDHPQVLSSTVETFNLLNQLLKDHPELTILLINDYLAVGNKPLLLPDFYKGAFIKMMKTKGVEWMAFFRGLPFAQLEDLVGSLAASGDALIKPTKYIKLGKIKLRESGKISSDERFDPEPDAGGVVNILDIGFQSQEQIIKNIYQSCREQTHIDLTLVERIVTDLKVIVRESHPLKLLSKIKSHDEYTFTHSSNVGILSMALAQRAGFNESSLNKIGIAALLHDVGKTTTPDDILLKNGPLTHKERVVMEEHAIQGALYLMNIKGVHRLAVLAALEHHIKYDGSGYPKMKGSWRPNIVSQIITIADVYDALRSIRPYRDAMPHHQIIKVLTEGSGATFNPYLVKFFLELIG